MISLEQVQLLEAKVANAIEYLQILSMENASLVSEKQSLHDKLEANQKRLDELETLVLRFKEDQGRIEDGIIAALDRLSQFEEAFENGLKDKSTEKKIPSKKTEAAVPAEGVAATVGTTKDTQTQKNEFFEINEPETSQDELDIF